jgi:inhibitor of cysteine peptidase
MNETNSTPINSQPDVQKVNDQPHFRKFINHLSLLLVFIMFSLILGYMTAQFFCKEKSLDFGGINLNILNDKGSAQFDFIKFKSDEEFKEFVTQSNDFAVGLFGGAPGGAMMMESADSLEMAPRTTFRALSGDGGGEPKRTSGTNIQVEGVDEPDIVKATGKTIFTSFRNDFVRPVPMEEPGMRFDPLLEEDVVDSVESMELMPSPPPPPDIINSNLTKIVTAFPPEDLEVIGGVDEIGNLLYVDDILIILTDQKVLGYDVSKLSDPNKLWEIKYENGSSYKDARINDGKLYLVTQTYLYDSRPCPLSPLILENGSFTISCTDIYHPTNVISTDVTFTVLKVDPDTGAVDDSLNFVGSSGTSLIYMSEDNFYATYSFTEDYVGIMSGFILEEGADIFPNEMKTKIQKLNSYDIGQTAKLIEFQAILQKYISSIDDDEGLKLQTEFENGFEKYSKNHLREFTSTGIVKINKDSLNIDATGEVPGHPLNQFSLDEYKGNLRIATNVGNDFGFNSTGDENDVYVLNKDLNQLGNVMGLGVDERIYSTRFIGNKGYVVTFKETDPFYVLDLSDPTKPELKGELKIPGYSSYLHPIDEDHILGVGMEDSKVKLSLFDVSDPNEPLEKDKYTLDEYWSEILNTHHAFLMDSRFKVFFIPGSKGGYIFSYADDKLKLIKTDSNFNVKRAVYMDDYLYIISTDRITVLNEKTWEEIKELDF